MGAARRQRRPRRGALVIIAALLVGSAVIRTGIGAGAAFARTETETTPAVVAAQECKSDADMAALLVALQQREDSLQRRESQVRLRMQALAAADTEVQKKLDALREAEAKLRDTIALAETASEDDINRLVAVYEAMKPKEAAALFDTMEPAFSAGFIARMRPEAAAPILAGMRAEAAYSVSAILAGRNAEVPRK
jgi:flagellar motility protein MotE (MotC chaperone)